MIHSVHETTKFTHEINLNLLEDIIEEEMRLMQLPESFTKSGNMNQTTKSRIINAYVIAVLLTYFQKKNNETFSFSSGYFKLKFGCHSEFGFFSIIKIFKHLYSKKYKRMRVKYDYFTPKEHIHLKSKIGIKIDYDESLINKSKQWINSNNLLVIESYEIYEITYDSNNSKQYYLLGDNIPINQTIFKNTILWNTIIQKINYFFDNFEKEKKEIIKNICINAQNNLPYLDYYQKHSYKFLPGELESLLKEYKFIS